MTKPANCYLLQRKTSGRSQNRFQKKDERLAGGAGIRLPSDYLLVFLFPNENQKETLKEHIMNMKKKIKIKREGRKRRKEDKNMK